MIDIAVNVEEIRERYPEGTKIKIVRMRDVRPIKPGTIGVVKHIDDIGTLHCCFEDGKQLGVCPEVDEFIKLED